jgi:hypothetical protein
MMFGLLNRAKGNGLRSRGIQKLEGLIRVHVPKQQDEKTWESFLHK